MRTQTFNTDDADTCVPYEKKDTNTQKDTHKQNLHAQNAQEETELIASFIMIREVHVSRDFPRLPFSFDKWIDSRIMIGPE